MDLIFSIPTTITHKRYLQILTSALSAQSSLSKIVTDTLTHKGYILDTSMKVEKMSKIAPLGKLRAWGKRTIRLEAGWSSLSVSNCLTLEMGEGCLQKPREYNTEGESISSVLGVCREEDHSHLRWKKQASTLSHHPLSCISQESSQPMGGEECYSQSEGRKSLLVSAPVEALWWVPAWRTSGGIGWGCLLLDLSFFFFPLLWALTVGLGYIRNEVGGTRKTKFCPVGYAKDVLRWKVLKFSERWCTQHFSWNLCVSNAKLSETMGLRLPTFLKLNQSPGQGVGMSSWYAKVASLVSICTAIN